MNLKDVYATRKPSLRQGFPDKYHLEGNRSTLVFPRYLAWMLPPLLRQQLANLPANRRTQIKVRLEDLLAYRDAYNIYKQALTGLIGRQDLTPEAIREEVSNRCQEMQAAAPIAED